jgi:hypothetical protein
MTTATKTNRLAEETLESVNIRIFGKVALVRATGIWNRKDGSVGIIRYTDFYVQENEEWKAVSAQVTRFRGALEDTTSDRK